MTTKFLDNIICTFKILLSWRFPRKNSVLDDFPLCLQGLPPSKSEHFIVIVVSPSLNLLGMDGISAWTSAGYPAPKLTLWAAFSVLITGATL